MQYIFVQTTNQHLFSTRLSRYTQPNMTALHVLRLSHVSLALRYEPGSTATRTKQALSNWLHCIALHLCVTIFNLQLGSWNYYSWV